MLGNKVYADEARQALQTLTPTELAQAKQGERIYLGHEMREGWSGHLPFFFFHCTSCGEASKDYPHGFSGRQYMLCAVCGQRHEYRPSLLDRLRNLTQQFTQTA